MNNISIINTKTNTKMKIRVKKPKKYSSTKRYSPKSYFKNKIYDDITDLIKTKNKKKKIKEADFEIPLFD